MCFFLHKQGYTFLNMNKLTYPEIKMLVDSKNREVKNKEREMKKSERKSKMAGRRR